VTIVGRLQHNSLTAWNITVQDVPLPDPCHGVAERIRNVNGGSRQKPRGNNTTVHLGRQQERFGAEPPCVSLCLDTVWRFERMGQLLIRNSLHANSTDVANIVCRKAVTPMRS
jgi:hypothetical protein